MILYQLRCGKDHEFEAWFKDGQTCERQLARKNVECPTCGNRTISKALMAPRIGAAEKAQRESLSARPAVTGQQPMSVMATAVRQHLQEVRAKVEENCDYVGDKFAEEARRIHYGETEARGIYGEATDDQHRDLVDEGVEVARIPWLPRSDA
ncbi:MAG: DUF1178 family protein [Dongiaceae bacterium]